MNQKMDLFAPFLKIFRTMKNSTYILKYLYVGLLAVGSINEKNSSFNHTFRPDWSPH